MGSTIDTGIQALSSHLVPYQTKLKHYAMDGGHTPFKSTCSTESLSGLRTCKQSMSFDSEKKSGRLLSYTSVSDQDSNMKKNSTTAPVSPKVQFFTMPDKTTILHDNRGSTEGESEITHSNHTDNTYGQSETPFSSNNATNIQLPIGNDKKEHELCHGSVGSNSDQFWEDSSKTTRNDDRQKQTNASNFNTLTREDDYEPKETYFFKTSRGNAKKLSGRRKGLCHSTADVSSNQSPVYGTPPLQLPGGRISKEKTQRVDENFSSKLVHASELSKSDTHVQNKGLGTIEELQPSLSDPECFELGLANKLARSYGTLSHLSDHSSQANERKHIIESTHELLEDYIRDNSVCNDKLEPVVLGRFQNAKEILEKTGMVIIKCAEKDGATHLGYNLMTAYEETRKCIVGNASEFLTCISGGDEPYTVLYDNAFGMTKFDGQEVDNWKTHIERSSMKRRRGSMKLIFILKYRNALDCQQFLNKNKASVLDLSDKTNQLNDEEKLFVLKRCVNRMNFQRTKTRIVLDKETLKDIANTAVSIGFFGMVEQFLSNKKNIDMGADFFRKPSIDLYRQIDSLKNSDDECDKNKYLALASVHLSAKRISKEDIAMLCRQSILDLTVSRKSVKTTTDLLGCSSSTKGSKSMVEPQNQAEMYKFLMKIALSIKCSTNLGKRVSDGIKLLEGKFLRKYQNSHTFSSPSIETAISISVGQDFPEITVRFCTNDFLHEYVGTDMSFSPDEARCIRIDLTKKDLCLTLFERLKKSLDSLDFRYFASHPLVRDARFVQVLQENWHEQQYFLARLRNRRKTFLDVAISARNNASGESLLVSSLDYPFYEQSSVDSRSLADWVIRHKKWKDFRKENAETATKLERLVTERCCRENWEEVYMSIVEYVKITSLTSACLFEAIRSGSLNITKDILSVSRFLEEDYERALEEALFRYARDMIQVRRNVLEEVVKVSKVTSLLTSLAKSGDEKSLGVMLHVLKNDVNKVCTAEGPILFLLTENNLGYLVEEVLRNFSFDLYAEFRGQLCIHKAAELGRLKIMQMLQEVDQTLLVKPNKWGKTPLHLSSSNGHVNCVIYMLKQNVDVNVRDFGGQTPLHSAAYLANAEVTHLLLENGADLDIEDNNGETARDIARRCKHDRVEKTLYKRISHPCDGALAAIRGLYEY